MQTISPYVYPILKNRTGKEIRFAVHYKRPLEAKHIVDTVLAYRGHTSDDISRRYGSRMVSYTKQLICYLLHTETRLSLSEMNVAMGVKAEHTTPLSNIKRIKNLLYIQDESTKQDIQNIKYLL